MADAQPQRGDRKSMNEFKKDLMVMVRVGRDADEAYAETRPEIDTAIKNVEKLVESFNKKYRHLQLKLEKKVDKLDLKILLDEESIKDAFHNCASKITGLQSVGARRFEAVEASSAEALNSEVEKAKEELHITYYTPQSGKTNVYLRFDSNEKKVELVYDYEEITIDISAEFQIAAHYALKEAPQKEIKIHEEAAALGFTTWPSHPQREKYQEKFDPRFTE